MTDSNALRAAIVGAGLKIPQLAELLDVSVQTFYNKINGKSEFFASEIDLLCDVLHLSVEQRMAIFFCVAK